MITEDKRGIYCDFCGEPLRDRFQYYSGVLHKVDVDRDRKQTTDVDRRFLDFDMCEKCFVNKVKKAMLKIIKQREKSIDVDKKGKWT